MTPEALRVLLVVILLLYGVLLVLPGIAFGTAAAMLIWLVTSPLLASRAWKPYLLLTVQGVAIKRFFGTEHHRPEDVRAQILEPEDSHCGDCRNDLEHPAT